MSLSATSIKRPVFAMVISLVLVIFGFVGFKFLEVREYPSVDPPIVTVTTNFPGANADIVETQITEILEQNINGIDGIRTLTSQSREGQSQITVEFNLTKNLEEAANDVRDRVSRSVKQLPQNVDNPSVEKADADATPIIFLTVYSDKRDILSVNDYATNVIKERMQTIPGVSTVRIFGEKKLAVKLRLDPEKMAAYKITPLDIQQVVAKENIELPSGKIEGNTTELSIRTQGRINNLSEFNDLIVKELNGKIVRFSDVGFAEFAPENERTALKRNGVPGIGIAVLPQAGANVIEISNEFKKRLEDLKKESPPDLILDLGFDFSTFVRSTITEVEETIMIAFALVILIIFLFLRDWRSTFIPVIAIPVSIIATFFVMYVFSFSINVLTLVGIILSIGLVCDDAIVVLENIYSKIEAGMSPVQAAFKGSREIYFAVISTTISLAAVFLPVIFLPGQTGRLFREFGVVVAGSVLISALVALSLSPMLSAYLLKQNDNPNWFYKKTEPFFVGMTNGYRKLLSSFMKLRWVAFIVFAASALIIYFMGSALKSELAPLEDRSNIRVSVLAPEGASYDFTQRYIDEMGQYIMDSVKEAAGPITISGQGGSTNTGSLILYLTPPEERKRTQEQIFQQINKGMNRFYGVRSFPSQSPTIGDRRGGQPLQYVILAPSYDSLVNVLPAFLDEAKKSPILLNVDANLKFNKPELTISINRSKAADLGVTISDIATTLQSTFSGQRFGYFIKDGKQYQIIGQVPRIDAMKPADLAKIFVRNKAGDLIQMDNLIDINQGTTAPSRYKFNRFSAATITATPSTGYTIGDGIIELDKIAAKVLNTNYSTALTGQARDFAENSSSLLFAFIFALVLIFLVLAAQFESFVDPFIILLTVPLAITGAVLSLWLFGQTLNIFSQIGIIILIGLVTKNAILIVEFANQKKNEGLNKFDAVIESSVSRFRPILMTSLAAILGILPIALGFGAGSRVSLGIVVACGLFFAGFLTLFIIPAMYSYLSSKKGKVEVMDETEVTIL
ncbi:efflux RND transporter permease subunit [soil metagenome]